MKFTNIILITAILFFAGYLGIVSGQSSVASGDTNLTIWDSSDYATVYANYTRFFVNYTNSSSGEAINGSGVYCEWRHNKTGSWKDRINMSYNETSKLYELIADGGYLAGHRDGMPYGNYSWNVSCYNNLGYVNLSITDDVNISLYSTALAIENGTDNPYTNQEVWFYANYTSTLMPVSGVGPDRYEIGQVVWNTSDLGDTTFSIGLFDCENSGERNCVVVGEQGDLWFYYPNGSQIKGNSAPMHNVYEIVVGDLDNDGYENMVVTTGYFGHVKVFNETGDQVWASSDFGDKVYSVVIGDLDNDGLKDDFAAGVDYGPAYNVMAFNTSDGVTWYNFWNSSQDFGGVPVGINIGDFDSDGDDDVVVGSNSEGIVAAFVGDNGTMFFNTTYLEFVWPVVTVDLDHDAYKDEIVVGSYRNLWTYKWNGTYGSTMNTTCDGGVNGCIWKSTEPQANTFELAIMDLDDDGWEDDIVVGDSGTINSKPGIIWGFNNDSTQLWNFTLPYNNDEDYIFSISIGDINDDGIKEIVFSSEEFDRIYVINKNGSLLWEYTIGLGNIGHQWGSSAIDISDINNDGINDIAVASADGYAHILQDVNCIARFNDSTSYNMVWDVSANKWSANKSFSSAETYSYNITCEKGGYESQISSSSITVQSDTTPPNVTSVSDTPDPQGLGENVTISATVTDNVGVDTVLVGITPPDGNEVNYTMTNQSSIYTYNYLNYTNGTYNYTIYAKDFSGNLNYSESGMFELYSDVYLHIKTLKDTYGANEIVNITDPFEFDLSGLVADEAADVIEDDSSDLDAEEEKIDEASKIFNSVSGYLKDLFNDVLSITGMIVGGVSAGSMSASADIEDAGVRTQEDGVYYVSPTGSALWSQCTNISTPCSLSTANQNAVAGDTIYLKGGDYNYNGAVRAIEPSNSGTSDNKITFEAASGETPRLVKTDGPTVSNSYGASLSYKDYIVIKGITFEDWWSGVYIGHSDYNEIADCMFYQTIEVYSFHGMNIKYGSNHNWIHGNTLYNYAGAPGCAEGNDGIKVGGTESISLDNYNTLEDNVIYHMGHAVTEDFGMYNVWRNNVAHNEGWKEDPGGCSISADPVGHDPGDGKYGHRCFAATGYDTGTRKHLLFEGNRFGYASANPVNNGADGFTLGSPGNIVRYNKIFGCDGPGINLKAYGGSSVNGAYNRIYHNTLYKNGRYFSTGFHRAAFEKYNDIKSIGNVVKNNLIYDHVVDFSCAGSGCDFDDWVFASNLCGATTNGDYGCTALTGNPFAADATDMTDMTSTTNPPLELSSDSQAIDSGTHLTTVVASDTGIGTTLMVDDALYFQDGSWGSLLSDIKADWIAVGTVDNVVQISSIDYDTDTITLANSISRNDGDPIWLYKDSSGKIVLYGSAPDIGAHEYISQETPPTRANPSPNGTLAAGTTSTNISLTTDVQATCRYSNLSGTNYTEMTGTFTNTDSTSHSTLVGPLSSGNTYTYYIRCNSTDGYYNENDWNITFSVDGGHKADTDNGGVIDMPELMAFIARWKANATDVSKEEVEEARGIWFDGGGY